MTKNKDFTSKFEFPKKILIGNFERENLEARRIEFQNFFQQPNIKDLSEMKEFLEFKKKIQERKKYFKKVSFFTSNHNYTAKDEGEMSFKRGDVIVCFEKDDKIGYCFGCLKENPEAYGFFPILEIDKDAEKICEEVLSFSVASEFETTSLQYDIQKRNGYKKNIGNKRQFIIQKDVDNPYFQKNTIPTPKTPNLKDDIKMYTSEEIKSKPKPPPRSNTVLTNPTNEKKEGKSIIETMINQKEKIPIIKKNDEPISIKQEKVRKEEKSGSVIQNEKDKELNKVQSLIQKNEKNRNVSQSIMIPNNFNQTNGTSSPPKWMLELEKKKKLKEEIKK